MLQVSVGYIFTFLDYAVTANGNLLVLSTFHNNEMSVKGVCANIGLGHETVRIMNQDSIIASFPSDMIMSNYYSKQQVGKENVYQCVCISEQINKDIFFIRKGHRMEDLYAFFMNQFTYPLLPEWMEYFWDEAVKRQFVKILEVEIIGETDLFHNYEAVQCMMNDEDLREILTEGLAAKAIRITDQEQEQLYFSDMDDYFKRYGHTLVDNLEKLLKPLSPMKEKVEELAFISKRPFPQQAAIINGAVECLNHKKYAFLIEGMGSGKTLQAMGIVEAYFNRSYMKQHPDVSIQDIYADGRMVKYRSIIMCPPHLVQKWADSIHDEVPYARVEILENLSQLIKLRKKGKERTGKEYYIISKDAGKLSYSYVPVPKQMKMKEVKVPVCAKCGCEYPVGQKAVCRCGCGRRILEEKVTEYGLVCPECGELLLPADGKSAYDENLGMYRVLQPEDFAQQSSENRICRCCGAALWAPACKPIDDRILFRRPKPKPKKWKKISHFSNRAMKGRKSVWVMASREKEYKKLHGVTDEEIEEMDYYGPRRFGMTRYIKKYLKGYFDIAVFDEVQDYKAGGSAQGCAMHDLIKAAKKSLALTGTIAAGYASDLFYTLYRLDPARMKGKGYTFGSTGERKFVEKYGTVETVYEYCENTAYNKMSRGRVLTPTRCLPGISVLIFTDFLLDTALFLDLSDLSRFLPKLYEEVVIVPLEDKIYASYQDVRQRLKTYMHEERTKILLGSFLQFSLSYTDMPYNRQPILSPEDGEVVVEPDEHADLVKDGGLLNKERELVKIVKKERDERRNCFVYCEYTGDGVGSISYRLKEILEERCGLRSQEVVVLESSHPAAVKREGWMHQKAAEGAKIFITNAKCVSTGLDFAFQYHGKSYNYPTIIFYQTGYDMIKIWQGSHRHYRLNQTEECRTYFLVSERTIQVDAVKLVATKEVATSAIQGQFSSEGLYMMARGVDPRVVLAQSVADKSERKEHGLRRMMDVINQRNNQDKGEISYEKMLIFSELTGLEKVPILEDPLSEFEWLTGGDVLDLLELTLMTPEEENWPEDLIEAEDTEKDKEQMIDKTAREEELLAEELLVNPEEEPESELVSLLDLIF